MQGSDRPNVVLIVIDTARASAFSSYGCELDATPRIDKIASQSVLYANAVSASPWTLPSHATLFTGEYPSEHGCTRISYELAQGKRTLAGVLSEQDYYTVSVARNPMLSRQTGILQGFREIHCLEQYHTDIDLIRDLVDGYDSAGGFSKFLRLHEGFRKGPYLKNLDNFFFYWLTQKSKRFRECRYYQKRSRSVNRLAKTSIRRCAEKSEPFFLFVNYMENHLPYIPPREFYRDRHPERIPNGYSEVIKNELPLYNFGLRKLADADRAKLNVTYHGAMRYVDTLVDDLYQYLIRMGLLENTIFIITSDHGENLGEHDLLDHRYCLFDTLLKVPLIVHYPNHEFSGRVVDQYVQPNDVFNTIMDVIGLPEQGAGGGYSLHPDQISRNPRDLAFAEYLGVHKLVRYMTEKYPEINNRELRSDDLKCIYRRNHKFILSSSGKELLFDLSDDPGELKPLTDEGLGAEMKSELLNRLGDFPVGDGKASRLEESIAWKLKTLGYM